MPVVGSPMKPTKSRPTPTCVAPTASDVAVPKIVEKMARTSMSLPSGPSARRTPMSGMNAEEMSCLRPMRKVAYAMARPTTAYIDHGWMVQCSSVCANAVATGAASDAPGGGLM